MPGALGNPGNYFYFMQAFRSFGGQFFNPRTMAAEINGPAGVKAMNVILKELKASPPGSEKFDFLTMWTTWLQGKTAMLYTWPPTGRISENYAQRDKAFSFLPKSKIVGKVGYAVVPGKNGWIQRRRQVRLGGFGEPGRGVPLHAVEHESVCVPAAGHAPLLATGSVPLSHYKSKKTARSGRRRAEYLKGLNNAANTGVVELVMTGAADYLHRVGQGDDRDVLRQGRPGTSTTLRRSGTRSQSGLGVETARASYSNFLKITGSTGRTTAEAKGIAVKI